MKDRVENQSDPDPNIVIGLARLPSTRDAAIIESGKKLFVESVDTGRDYCKHMISISSGAIPAYLALLVLGRPKDYAPSHLEYLLWAIPPILLLISVLMFSWGYTPARGKMNMGDLRNIESNIGSLIDRRHRWSLLGVAFFSIGTICGGAVVILIR